MNGSPEPLEDTPQCVADDGRSQMTHVHLLGDVDRAQVDHHGVLIGVRDDAQ